MFIKNDDNDVLPDVRICGDRRQCKSPAAENTADRNQKKSLTAAQRDHDFLKKDQTNLK